MGLNSQPVGSPDTIEHNNPIYDTDENGAIDVMDEAAIHNLISDDYSAITHDHTGETINPAVTNADTALRGPRDHGLVVSNTVGYQESFDPANTTTPVQDAMDALAIYGGGEVHLPPNETVSETGPIQPYSGIELYSYGSTIEITGAGDGLVVSNSNPNESGTYVQFDIRGELEIQGQGDTAGQGHAVRMGSTTANGMSNSTWDHVRIRDWDGVAWFGQGGSFQNHFRHLYFTQVDAGDANGVIDLQGGGAPERIDFLTAYPSDTGSVADSHILRTDSGSWHVGTLNVGGTAAQALRANVSGSNGMLIGAINWEPSFQNSTPNAVVFANGNNPVEVGTLIVRGTVDYAFGQFSAANNNFGKVRNMGTINLNLLDNRNDTTGQNIVEFSSGDVTDNSGVALTTPISCLGDLTTVS